MAAWIQRETPGEQGFYQVRRVRDLSVFPCKRYEAKVLLGPGDPSKVIPSIAGELSNAVRGLGYHPTVEARSAYHKRDAEEVLIRYHTDLRGLTYNTPCGRTLWSLRDDNGEARPIRWADETATPGIDLEWSTGHDTLRRCMDERQGAPGRWPEEGPRLRQQASRTIDEAGHLYSAFNRGMLSWRNLEHRLGELGRWLDSTSEAFGRMPPPRGDIEDPVASLERFIVSARGILLPFAPWARETTDPEDLSWFLEDAFAHFHEAEARVTEAWSNPR